MYKIPSIIPRHRLYGVLIALIFSSSLFIGSNAVLFSMMNVSDDFFGSDENVIVFYNTRSSTPFTSQVDRLYANSFSSVPGVEVVSPEIFQSVTINDKAGYIRGVNYSSISKLDSINIIEGKFPNNPLEAVIGVDLANRMNIDVDEVVVLNSLLTNERIPITISGIISAEAITSDEILTSFLVARTLANLEPNLVTHIRIKYNDAITTRERVLETGTSSYNLNLNVSNGNDTSVAPNQIRIRTEDDTVFEDTLDENREIQILHGNYLLEILNQTHVIQSNVIYMDSDRDIHFDYQNFVFQAEFYLNGLMETGINLAYVIEKNNRTIRNGNFTNGYLNETLPPNNYTIKVRGSIYEKRFDIQHIKPSSYELDISDFRTVTFDNFENNSIIPYNSFKLRFEDIDPNFDYFINDTRLLIDYTDYDETESISITLDDGKYRLISKTKDTNSIVNTFNFEVINNFDYFNSSLNNFAHISVYDKPNVSIRGIKNDTLVSNKNFVYIKPDMIRIDHDFEIGYHYIRFSGKNHLGEIVQKNYYIFVEEDPSLGGWREPIQKPIVKSGDDLIVWTNSSVSSINATLGQIVQSGSYFRYSVPNLSQGNYSDSITTNLGSFLLEFELVNNYKSLFSFTNQTNTYNFNQTVYSNFVLNYPNRSFPAQNNNFWEIDMTLNSTSFLVNPLQKVFLPNTSSLQVGEIRIKNKITESTEIFNFEFLDVENETNFPNLHFGYPNDIISGNIDLTGISNYNYEIFVSNNTFNPMYTDTNAINLPPDKYDLIIYNGDSNYTWSFTISNWSRNLVSSLSFVSVDHGYINQKGGVYFSSVYYDDQSSYKIGSDINPDLTYRKLINSTNIEINLIGFSSANISIDYNNGTLIQENYINSTYFIKTNNNSVIDVQLAGTNRNNQTMVIERSINAEFNFISPTIFVNYLNQNGDIIVNSKLHETDINFNTTLNKSNTSLSFETITQNATISIYSNSNLLFNQTYFLTDNLNITFGYVFVDFMFYNQNYNFTSSSSNLKLSGDNSTVQLNYQGQILSIPYGNYTIEFENQEFSGSEVVSINTNATVLLEYEITNTTSSINLHNLPENLISRITLSHSYLDYQKTYLTQFSENYQLSISNIPIGPYTIVINGTWGMRSDNFVVDSNTQAYSIVIIESDNEEEILNPNPDKINYGGSISGDYLDGFLKGALNIITIIIVTEILIIFIIIFVNFIEIFKYVVYETKDEINVFRSIGGTTNQTVFAYSKFIIYSTLLIAFVSQIIANYLVQFLFITNNTIFFGHQFRPNPNTPLIILINVLLILGLTIFSSRLALKSEMDV